jgi:hypothetical protein
VCSEERRVRRRRRVRVAEISGPGEIQELIRSQPRFAGERREAMGR